MSLRLPGRFPRVPDRIDTILRRGTFTALGLLTVLLLTHKIFNSDIWWHVKTGERILQGHGIPQTDPYLSTAMPFEWIDMHWGFQVIAALAFRVGRGVGLNLLLYVVMGAAIFVTLRNQYTRRYWSLTAVFGLLLVLTINARFLVRPEMFSFLLLATVVWLIMHQRDAKAGQWLWALPAVIALWANMQGLFILGVVLVGFAAAGVMLRRMLPMPNEWPGPTPLSPEQMRRLFIVTALCMFAGAATPYGFRGLLFPALLFTRVSGQQNIFSDAIAEFQPLIGRGQLSTPLETFWIFAVLAAAAVIANIRYLSLGELLWLVAFMFLGITARRNVAPAVIVLTPLAIQCATELIDRYQQRVLWDVGGMRSWVQGGLGIIVILVALWHVPMILSDRYYRNDRRGEQFGLGVANNMYPGGALDFMVEHDLPGPLFNSMYIGGYAIYRLSPEIMPVSLDSRLEVNSEEMLSDYLESTLDWRRLGGHLRQQGIRTAVITHHTEDVGTLFSGFLRLKDWHLVYFDPCGAVFVETSVMQTYRLAPVRFPLRIPGGIQPVSSGLDDDAPQWARALQAGVDRLRVGPVWPGEIFNVAIIYIQFGLYIDAVELLIQGLEQYPASGHGWYNLGLAYLGLGDVENAERAFNRAIENEPRLHRALASLGNIARERGELDEAIAFYRRAIRANSANTDARFWLARTLARTGNYRAAYGHYLYLTELEDATIGADLYQELAVVSQNLGRWNDAEAAIDRAIELNPGSAEFWCVRFDILVAAGDPDAATGALRRAQEIDPASPEVRRRMREYFQPVP